MKKFLVLSVIMALTGITAFAQNNSYDDRYYSGSKAQDDAKKEAKTARKDQQHSADYESYNSSNGYQPDDNSSVSDDAYIDYDDDSYATRINRFNYPFYGTGYWGGVYSPYMYNPWYSNPYYSWNGWYSPGFSMGFGWGGPYWSSCWGYNAWYGYGGFSPYYAYSWGYPGYGWGGGYGLGYWNGYYDGMYGNNYSNPRNTMYGPRGGRNNIGNYTGGRMASTDRGTRVVLPQRPGINTGGARAGIDRNSRSFQTEGRGANSTVVFDNNRRATTINNGNTAPNRNVAPVNGGQRNAGVVYPNNNGRQAQPVAPSRNQSSNFNGSSRSDRSFQPSNSGRSTSPSFNPGRSSGGSFGGGRPSSGGGGGRSMGGRR